MTKAVALDRDVLDELRSLFGKAKLPTSPALAAQLLELANDPNTTIDRFAELIQLDPIMAARLLRLANSSQFAQRNEVTTIQRAVILLGIQRVRTLSLSFQLVGHLDKLGKCPFDIKKYWQHSLLRGCLARELAEEVAPSCSEEAFLVGLLQDCGILVLVQILGMQYANLYRTGNLSPAAFHEAEFAQFRFNHVQTVVALAQEWQLPAAIVQPLAKHHTRTELSADSTDLDRLSAVGFLVASIGLADDLSADPALAEYARTGLGLDEVTLRKCIDRAGGAYNEVGQLLRDCLPEDLDVTDLLGRANECLNSAAREAEQRAETAQGERDAIEKAQVHLKHALGEYRDRAARDPLTNVLNRGGLVETVREALRRAREQRQPVVVLFLDLDNFKSLNDCYGHRTGDEVLIRVARALCSARKNSGIVGRYGGEEFVWFHCGLEEVEAVRLAGEVVESVRSLEFPELGLPAPVTCSLGAIWGIPQSEDHTESLFSAADQLMYEAKRSGKDRFVFHTLTHRDQSVSPSGVAAADAVVSAVDGRQLAESHAVPADFERIARKLSERPSSRFACYRKQPRKQLLTPCTLASFTGMDFRLSTEDAFVRNISTGGVGILTASEKRRGEPIEVAIHSFKEGALYVAGVVAYCRHVEGSIHEVGVQLFAHGRVPVLSSDPISAIQNLDWVASALKSLST